LNAPADPTLENPKCDTRILVFKLFACNFNLYRYDEALQAEMASRGQKPTLSHTSSTAGVAERSSVVVAGAVQFEGCTVVTCSFESAWFQTLNPQCDALVSKVRFFQMTRSFESAWFQTLNLRCDILVSSLCFQTPTCTVT
jgi:hypothetical protein